MPKTVGSSCTVPFHTIEGPSGFEVARNSSASTFKWEPIAGLLGTKSGGLAPGKLLRSLLIVITSHLKFQIDWGMDSSESVESTLELHQCVIEKY
jgi:hypothetical protein